MGGCTKENKARPECVVQCGYGFNGYDLSGGHTFCRDCRVEECEKDWDKCCSDCVKTIGGPSIVKENKRLRRQERPS